MNKSKFNLANPFLVLEVWNFIQPYCFLRFLPPFFHCEANRVFYSLCNLSLLVSCRKSLLFLDPFFIYVIFILFFTCTTSALVIFTLSSFLLVVVQVCARLNLRSTHCLMFPFSFYFYISVLVSPEIFISGLNLFPSMWKFLLFSTERRSVK